ncbi:chondroitinase-B domain-containing protein [Pontibacter oryzae]|uniref:T9SS C-terminal target domain-containing protein n=1 Tax=Pontibacter oryzae TaxID=2304593 RepID=A0A399SLE6_9BACT|nr:chondroitinase-B domain-containing protein [Pontibacter oryzae]RIJ43062.1 T9SS C-terminal target domain-containing protein [Pontibacter oryzae]
MKKTPLLLLLLIIVRTVLAQTPLQTSFEGPLYVSGGIHNQNGWKVSSGNAQISTSVAKTGDQALQLSAQNTALQLDFIPYSGTVTGLRDEVYADFWVNPIAFTTRGIALNGYDLFGGSSKRIFVVEFTTDNKIKAYNGSSGNNVGVWAANEWVRVSVKVDFSAEKYKVAINGTASATEFNFRETYTPTASGTRAAGVKEFHSLRINHTSDTQVATSEVSIDDVYISTTPIPDVSFGASSTSRTITVTQPAYGTITLSPTAATYELNESVTATLTLPEGYKNNGWTGSLSGSELVKSFTVTGNMSIGADTGVDPANPPALYTVSITHPSNGTITLAPASPDGKYYKETKVTATISHEACYQFDGWTGDLSGNQTSKTFTVAADMSIGATVGVNTTPAVKRNVATVTEFKNALNAMNPGDTIVVADGNYSLGGTTISRSGCENKPIVIMAKNQGQAIITGNTSFTLESVKHITLQGFAIKSAGISTGIKIQNSSRVRIIGNSFAISETSSCNWIYIGDTWGSTAPIKSGGNVIAYNQFDGKTQAGKYIVIDGSATQQSQHDTIRYNLFKNNGPRATNEKESIRVGTSTLSMSSGFTVIEYNLFQDCDGDPEVVSIKSCDNIIRHNTFQRSLGTLSLRHGNRNLVEGNYFFGEGKTAIFNGSTIGCGGVRVYGKDHKVINNYFEGLTGEKWDAACTITNGNVTNTSTSLTEHFLPENLVFAFNTLVNNKSNIEIGFDNNGNYNRAPVNCLIANNIVVENANPIIKSYSTASLAGVSFSGNIMYPTAASSIGITASDAQIKNIDPLLMQPPCSGNDCEQAMAYKVLRLNPESPAIDAAVGTYAYVGSDFEGQSRAGILDVGADEFRGNSPAPKGALGEHHVGPSAVSYDYKYQYGNLLSASPAMNQPGISVFPNPAANVLTVHFGKQPATNVEIVMLNSTGAVVKKISGLYGAEVEMRVTTVPSGLYFIQIKKAGKIISTHTIIVAH